MAEFHNTLSRVTVYGTDGRISSAGFLHGRVEKQFTYAYLPGTNLLQTLTKPNNMTLTQSYEPQRNLLTGMLYKRGNTAVAQRTYTYDTLGRPLTRTTARNGQTVNDSSGYIRTAYTYSPYGQISSTGDVEQPIQWSSEFNDTELGLTYYNYRHYNPVDGRWLGRDKKDSATGNHIYAYVSNFPVLHGDQLGEDRYYYCYSGDIGLHGVLIIDN